MCFQHSAEEESFSTHHQQPSQEQTFFRVPGVDIMNESRTQESLDPKQACLWAHPSTNHDMLALTRKRYLCVKSHALSYRLNTYVQAIIPGCTFLTMPCQASRGCEENLSQEWAKYGPPKDFIWPVEGPSAPAGLGVGVGVGEQSGPCHVLPVQPPQGVCRSRSSAQPDSAWLLLPVCPAPTAGGARWRGQAGFARTN